MVKNWSIISDIKPLFWEKFEKFDFCPSISPQNKVMKALMMSKKMVLHIFSRHYLIFYGHLESLWSFFTLTANEKIRYLRLLCSIFVVVLPPLVYLLAETWHWAICTHKMIFSFFSMSCSFPSVKATKAAFPPDFNGDRLFFVPFTLARSLQNHLYSPNTDIQSHFFKNTKTWFESLGSFW